MTGKLKHRFWTAAAAALLVGGSVGAGPVIHIEEGELGVACPQGAVVTGVVEVFNAGDAALDWQASDLIDNPNLVRIIREFQLTGTQRTLTYDSSNDVLWVGWYGSTEIRKVSTADGTVLATKNADTNKVAALDMDGGDLWTADWGNKLFKRFRLSDMAVLETVAIPSTWTYGPAAFARDGGRYYACQGGYQSYSTGPPLISKINPSGNAVEADFRTSGGFAPGGRHIDAVAGNVWYLRYGTTPRNSMCRIDGDDGSLLRAIALSTWQDSGSFYDISFAGNESQCWVLSYDLYDQNKQRAHLLDLSRTLQISEAPRAGSTAAETGSDVSVVLDSSGLPTGLYPEGADIWVGDGSDRSLKRISLSDMTVKETVPLPWGSLSAAGMAIGDGGLYATCSYSAYTNIYRLNRSSGAIVDTFPTRTAFGMSYNGIAYGDGGLWWSLWRDADRVELQHNVIKKMDPSTGATLEIVLFEEWAEDCDIFDLSFQGTNALCWLLTTGTGGSWINKAHLVDLSRTRYIAPSAGNGSVAAGASQTIELVFDARNASIGTYPVGLVFKSNDPDERFVTNDVLFVVHPDGPNAAPTAHAGPDRSGECDDEVGAVFFMDGSQSTDPDGDVLRYIWSHDGVEIGRGPSALVPVPAGTNTIVLTVDDYRGATNADEMVFTVTIKDSTTDWPQWLGPDRNAVSRETDWLHNWPPIELWRRNVNGHTYRSVSARGGCVYVQASGDTLWSLDERDGSVIWKRNCHKNKTGGMSYYGVKTAPVIDHDRVYSWHDTGDMYCTDRATGQHIWHHNFSQDHSKYGIGDSPVVEGDLVFVGSKEPYVLNKHTGQIYGRHYYYSSITYGGPAAVSWQGKRYFFMDRAFFDPITLEQAPISVAPNRYDRMYEPCFYGTNYIFTGEAVKRIGSSEELWRWPEKYPDCPFAWQWWTPAVIGDYLYGLTTRSAGGPGGTLICIDLRNGEAKWTGPRVYGCIGTADGKLIVWTGGGALVVEADPSGYSTEGRRVHKLEGLTGVSWTTPVLSNKRIYFRPGNAVVCLYTGLAAPVVENRGANAYSSSAELRGRLINTGGRAAGVVACWGTADGGDDPVGWQHSVSLGPKNVGAFSAVVTGLLDNAIYYYRFFGTNSIGTAGAKDGADRFSTYAASSVECSDDLLLHWPLDEASGVSAVDISGNGNHGTASKSTSWAPGILGGGIKLDATVNSPSRLSATLTDNWTLSFWVRFTENHAMFRLGYDSSLISSILIESSKSKLRLAGVDQGLVMNDGQASDDAAAFASSAYDISSRAVTRVGVPWSPGAWSVGDSGTAQTTPDLGGIVQAVVDRSGWSSNNAIAFIVGGSGQRIADASEKSAGQAAQLKVMWVERPDGDGDQLPDCWERASGMLPPSVFSPYVDQDGDRAVNWQEYLAGTDAQDPLDVLKLRLRVLSDGRVVVGFDGCAATGIGYEGLTRSYTLAARDTLTDAAPGVTETVWLEDFNLPDGTKVDTGDTAWTSDAEGRTLKVSGQAFMGQDIDDRNAVWRSEWITVGREESTDISVDIRSEGNMGSDDNIKLYYAIDGSAQETLFAARYDNFNGNAYETVSVHALTAARIQIIVRVDNDSTNRRHYFDNVTVVTHSRPAWPAVPGMSDIPVNSDRLIEYTNSTPAACGFYRVKARLE